MWIDIAIVYNFFRLSGQENLKLKNKKINIYYLQNNIKIKQESNRYKVSKVWVHVQIQIRCPKENLFIVG